MFCFSCTNVLQVQDTLKITTNLLRIVENQMQADDETTAVPLRKILVNKGHPLSLKTILASREKLGWTFRGSAYCRVIRQKKQTEASSVGKRTPGRGSK